MVAGARRRSVCRRTRWSSSPVVSKFAEHQPHGPGVSPPFVHVTPWGVGLRRDLEAAELIADLPADDGQPAVTTQRAALPAHRLGRTGTDCAPARWRSRCGWRSRRRCRRRWAGTGCDRTDERQHAALLLWTAHLQV